MTYSVVKNVGAIEFTATGQQNTAGETKSRNSTAPGGTVRVVVQNVEYVWGPNDSKTLEQGIAAAAVAADGRLRVADTRDGVANQTGKAVS